MENFNLIKNAGIYITRRCNLNCTYCNVNNTNLNELEAKKWCEAIKILDHIGIKKLTILGGEPTLKEGLVDIVKFIVNNTKFDLNVVSNGTSSRKIIDQLIENGLKKFSSSIDTISGQGKDKYSLLKSKIAMENFEYLRSKDQNHVKLTAYFVLNKQSAKEIISIIKHLSYKNIHIYILPYHYSQNEINWATRAHKKNESLALDNMEKQDLENLLQQIVLLKQNGFLIDNYENYLLNLPTYVKNFSWHCQPNISELRIDSDGSLMCCHDFIGEHSRKYNVFDLSNYKKYVEFIEIRKEDSQKCSGCYWPSQYHSAL